jgi:hypothetical protein
VLISDILPNTLNYLSSSPQLDPPLTNLVNGRWRLEYSKLYYNAASFELTDGAGKILAQKLEGDSNDYE